MSSKEKSEKKQNSNGHMNGVLITVYVETSTPRSRKLHNPMKADQHYKRKRSSGKQGYECDRRAQLLAYPQQLRNASSQEDECKVQLRTNQSRSKTKRGIWLTQPVRICSPSSQMLRHANSPRKNEGVAFKESKQVNHRSREKGTVGDKSSFLKKVKSILRQMSCKEVKQ
ncbi:hypothetical protein L6164_030525 [Bauhinia variegata]|uniref:Uncharacterized protein n=1 Tax=Bauhinia variegata TaxID=167791 RepID=A0ACB9LCN5_BAUVA|nr:hypothetical protein L6164_030525 [Bauhinia variegata]